ncbi:MAG: extracellular solute-binding protein [Pseudomonadota bacterium]
MTDIHRRRLLQWLAANSVGLMAAGGAIADHAIDPHSIRFLIRQSIKRLGSKKPEVLRVLAPAGSQSNLQPIIDSFRELTGIDTQVSLAPVDDINTQLLLEQMTASQPHDLAVIATFGVPDLAQSTAIQSIDRFESRYPALAELRQECLFALGDRFSGKTYGPQVDGDLYLLFYNTALLNAPAFRARHERLVGREPRPAATWSELDELMLVANEPDKGRYGGLLFRTPRYIVWEFWSRLHCNGVLPFDDEMRPRLTEPGARAALESLIAASASQHPATDRLSLTDNWAAFCQGNALVNIGWGGSQKYFRQHRDRFAQGIIVTQLPGYAGADGPVPLPYFNWGWTMAVPSVSQHPEVAYLFGALATLPVVSSQAIRQTDGFFDPYHPAHYDDPDIQKAYGESFLTAHKAGLKAAIPDLYIRGQGQYLDALSDKLILANRGAMTPIDALRSVSAQWERITDQLDRGQQKRQWRALRENYPKDYLNSLK